MRPALCIRAGRHDADGLAFEHRHGGGAEIEHDVADVAAAVFIRQPEIARDFGDGWRAQGIKIDAGCLCRPRRGDMTALSSRGLCGCCKHFVGQLRRAVLRLQRFLFRQLLPFQLRFDRIRLGGQLKRTYFASAGCLLMPTTGAAIQFAN